MKNHVAWFSVEPHKDKKDKLESLLTKLVKDYLMSCVFYNLKGFQHLVAN